jgi:hypothetical protein
MRVSHYHVLVIEEPYGLGDIIALTGATRAQMIHWANLKVVVPSVQESAGTGVPRLYNFEDAVVVRVAVELTSRFKTPTSTLRWVAQAVRTVWTGQFRAIWITRDRPSGDSGKAFVSVREFGAELVSPGFEEVEHDAIGTLVNLDAVIRTLVANGAAEPPASPWV